MKILGIDSSGLVASVAVTENDVLLAEFTTDYKKTHSQTLLPMLDEVKKMLDLDLHSLDAIAVAAGPGSFTGLRIGSATAKGLGFALDLPIVPVPTVDAIAYNLYGSRRLICPLLDARRQQAYTGLYRFDEDNRFLTVLDQRAVPVTEIIDEINRINEPVTFLGDGIPVFSSIISADCHVPYDFAPAHVNRQRASAVAALGQKLFDENRAVSADDFRPEYLRLSQAEREKKEELSEKGINDFKLPETITSSYDPQGNARPICTK